MHIAGIDLTGRELRLVVLDHTPLRTRLAGTARAALPPGAEPAAMGCAARDMLLAQGFGGARVVAGMGSRQAMIRRVVFPFASPGKIARVLRLELESLLPGPLAARAVSCVRVGEEASGKDAGAATSFLSLGRGGRHAFLAAAVPEDAVAGYREGLKSLDPEALDLDLTGLWRMAAAVREDPDAAPGAAPVGTGVRGLLAGLGLSRTGTASPGPLLALDAGEDRALMASFAGGQVRLARHVPLPDAGAAGEAWFEELFRQALLTLAAEAGFGPARVLVTGTQAGPELGARLEAAFKVGPGAGLCREVVCPAHPGRLIFSGQEKSSAVGPDMAVACGLALRGATGGGMDFLDDDPSGTTLAREVLGLSGRPGHARRAVVLAAGAALAVAAYGLDAHLDIRFKKAWLARLDGELATLAAQASPGARKGLDPSQYVSVIKDRLRETEASWPARLRSGVGGGLTQLLRTVSRAIPEGSPVVVGEFTVDGRRVRMTATADTYETVESVRKRLLDSGAFAGVEIKGATAKPGGSGVEFELEMTAAGQEAGA